METSHPDDDPLGGEAEEGHLHLGVVGAEHDGLEGDHQLEKPLLRVGSPLLPHVVQRRLGEVQAADGHPHWLVGRQGSRRFKMVHMCTRIVTNSLFGDDYYPDVDDPDVNPDEKQEAPGHLGFLVW